MLGDVGCVLTCCVHLAVFGGVLGADLFCSKCGATIPDESTYCMKCGQTTYAAGGAIAIAPAAAGAVAIPGGAAGAPVMNAGYVPAYEIRPVYAGFWLRFVAYVLDAIILGIFTVPILIGAAMLMGLGTVISSLPRNGDPFENGFPPVFALFMLVFVGVAFVGGWLYHALLESSEWQGTAGKRIVGIVVTDMGSTRVTFWRATGRYFAKFISGMIPLGIGYIIAGFTEKRQAIHDMLAGTLVLRKTQI
jgi:uncharacterized RDD family membrane protein YckC